MASPARQPQPPAMSQAQTTTDMDIERKMRLYGAFAALRESRMPTNAQIGDALEYVKANSPVDESKLSSEGRKLTGDIRDILSTLASFVNKKNHGEILQRFVWATRGVDTNALSPTEEEQGKGKQDVAKAKRDAQEAAHHLRTLLNLILTNAEMRKLLSDFGTVGRDLFAKGAAKAAKTVAPTQQELHEAEQPAPNDQFLEKDSLPNGKPSPRPGDMQPSSSVSDVDASSTDDSDTEQTAKTKEKRSLLSRIQSLHSTHKPRLDEGQTWLTEEFFPEERRERWIWRGKKVIVECQKHKDYQESVGWLLNMIDAWAARARQVGSDAQQGEGLLPAAVLAQDPSLRSALSLLRTLLERIAGAPLEPFIASARVLAKDAAGDESLRKWWSAVDSYVRKVLLDAGYVTEPASTTRARELRDMGRAFYDEKYKTHFDAVTDAVVFWFRSMAADPLNKRLAEDFGKLTKDLLFDSEGNLQFKRKLWEDVREVILPTLVDKVRSSATSPSPRVEYTDDNIDLIVENLTLSGRQLFPNVIEMEAHNYVRFSPYTSPPSGKKSAFRMSKQDTKDASRHEVTFAFEQIHATMRDVAFTFRTKTGIKMQDKGMLDVDLGGKGLAVLVTLVSSPSADTSSVFSVAQVRVKVGSLKLTIRDAKHGLLYKTLKPLATRLIKKQIQKAVADAVTTGFEYLDGQLVRVRSRIGKDDGELPREDAASLTGSATSVSVHGASASVSTGGGSQFKVVASKQQSLLPDSGHPAGWVNRVSEKEQQVVEGGDGWRSDAFDIAPGESSAGKGKVVSGPGAPKL
ncbi:hypothetical protein HMN09_01128400 [Mycena chlorophos]|uniref:Uncharacterized protein n=1 Tax=Mycena chlorophos TaxID=658473 RepID=A0A8H6SA91_MYCCL|nr:hypothetical protein HMN09_01128400 [Mycena chlorophos]